MVEQRFAVLIAVLALAVPTSGLAENKFDAAKTYISRTETPRTEGGSSLVRHQRTNGSIHETAYNSHRGVNTRFSRDIAPDGTISGAHWVDQTTGRKVTISD